MAGAFCTSGIPSSERSRNWNGAGLEQAKIEQVSQIKKKAFPVLIMGEDLSIFDNCRNIAL
jgi:hypothetical protein